VTKGFIEELVRQGVAVSEPRWWPLAWVNFRCHPCHYQPGVDRYRVRIRAGDEIEPIVLCRDCYVVLDGWHRMAAHWLEGKRSIRVVFADQHWMNKEICRVDLTNWIETLRPYTDLSFVSGAYQESDWDNPLFAQQRADLLAFGDRMPKMRLWEHVRAAIFLGNVRGKKILDVGTRESILPHYLASKGAIVTACDLNEGEIKPSDSITIVHADARDLPFEDESFDYVISSACIKHIPGWGDRTAVKEMARVLKPGGKLALTTNYGESYVPYPCPFVKARTYDKNSLYKRLVNPSRLRMVEPVDFDADWDSWPIKHHAPNVYRAGINLQVAFMLLEKE